MKRSWQVNYGALWISQLVAMLAFSAALPFLPLFIHDLGVSDAREAAAWAGILGFCNGFTMAVMAPIWGTMADRYGRKPMVVRAMLGGGVVVGAMGLVSSIWQLLALRVVQGGFSGTVAAARVLATSIVPRERLGSAIGFLATAAFIGTSIGPLFGGVIADQYGYRACFYATGALMLVAGLVTIVFVQERFERVESSSQRPGLRASLALLRARPDLNTLLLSIFMVQVGQMAVSPILPLFVLELTDGAAVASTTGTILGISAVSSAISAAVAGRIGDQIGHRRVLVVCALGASALYIPQALALAPWHLLVLRAALGVFIGGLIPTAMAMIGLATPTQNRGAIFGLTATAMALGNAFGPLLGAAAATVFGLRVAFLTTSIILAAGGVWVAVRARASDAHLPQATPEP
jgi:MFS transporter, DHA1 family, multidrug resistance protein